MGESSFFDAAIGNLGLGRWGNVVLMLAPTMILTAILIRAIAVT